MNKVLVYAGIFLVIVIVAFASFGKSGISNGNVVGNGKYNSLPEKCQPPAGQDIEAWKEHLGHHAETRDCLNYFK